MNDFLNASLICRFFAAIGGWFGRQWADSRIVRGFVEMKDPDRMAEASGIYRVGSRLRGVQLTLFEKLHLSRLFEGSIFAMPFLWCLIAAVLAPLIPTMVLLGFVLLGEAAMILDAGLHKERKLLCAPVNRYVLLYAVIYLTATFLSVTVSGSLYIGLLTTVLILSVFAIQNAVQTRKQLQILVTGLVCAGVIVALYGIYQHFFGTGGTETWIDEDMFSGISTRVYSTLQNPNVLAEYLLLVLPLTAGCLFAAKTRAKRAMYFAACCIMGLCMIYTFSRGGWLGLMFAAVVFLVLIDRRFIFLILLGGVVLVLFSPETITARFSSIGNMSDTSTSYRVSIWMGTLKMLKDYWITGIGPGTEAFNMVYPAYSYNTISAPHSHNLYLQIICDTGVLGVIVFLILVIVFIRMCCHALSHETDRTMRMLQAGILSGVLGFLLQSMTDYSFYNYRVMFLFWAYLALGIIVCRAGSLQDGDEI